MRLPWSPAKDAPQSQPSSPGEFAQQAMYRQLAFGARERPRQPARSSFETPLLAGLLAGIHRKGHDALDDKWTSSPERVGRHAFAGSAPERQLDAASRRRPATRSTTGNAAAAHQRTHHRYGPI